MKIVKADALIGSDRDVRCPKGGFQSLRMLLKKDGMGFSMHKTIIPVGKPQHWHYKHHLEACFCVSGVGVLTNLETSERHMIAPGTLYVLDNHDDHTFEAVQKVVLISVFTPPVAGAEVHLPDGSYVEVPE